MTEIELRRVEKAVSGFMKRHRPPVEIREELDLGYRFEKQSLELFEVRPRWKHQNEKIEHSVAKARYLRSRNEWWVYWKRADLKWRRYEPVPTVRSVEEFLAVVEKDSYGCFFG